MVQKAVPIAIIALLVGVAAGYVLQLPTVNTLQGDISALRSEVNAIKGQLRTVRFTFTGLEPLAEGHYEVWAIFPDETKLSLGAFNFDPQGNTISLAGYRINDFTSSRDLRDARKIAITIEPRGDKDPGPSGIIMLIGDISNGRANLSFKAIDLSSASGQFILATPSAGGKDPTSGIWFLRKEGDKLSIGLQLPSLVAGWKYEGWAVTQGVPLSTGKFSSADKADESAPYSESGATPPFPGEDFFRNAPPGMSFPVNLADGSSLAVITLEPDINGSDPTGAGPFSIKFLVAHIAQRLAPLTNSDMTLDLSGLPSGTASLA